MKWLETKSGQTISSHQIERELPDWAELHGVNMHNPGTYARAFRGIRARHPELVQEVDKHITQSKEKSWRILAKPDKSQLRLEL